MLTYFAASLQRRTPDWIMKTSSSDCCSRLCCLLLLSDVIASSSSTWCHWCHQSSSISITSSIMISRAVIKSSSSRDVIKSRTLRLALALWCPLQAPDADLKSRPLALHYRPSWEFVFMEACCGDHHTEPTRFSFFNLLHLDLLHNCCIS